MNIEIMFNKEHSKSMIMSSKCAMLFAGLTNARVTWNVSEHINNKRKFRILEALMNFHIFFILNSFKIILLVLLLFWDVFSSSLLKIRLGLWLCIGILLCPGSPPTFVQPLLDGTSVYTPMQW